jgi:hypothetical protein
MTAVVDAEPLLVETIETSSPAWVNIPFFTA